MKCLPLLKFLPLIMLSLLVARPQAKANPVKDNLHLGTGMVANDLGASIGSSNASLPVVPSFDVQFERFTSDRTSFVVRGILALDMATTVTRYVFGGVGQRYYLNGRGSSLEAITPEVSVIIRPKFRYYVGWDAGISEVVVNVLTASLQTVTTAIDGGGVAGAIYQIGDNLGIEASATMSYAFGFSSVSATGMVTKIFLGAVYSY